MQEKWRYNRRNLLYMIRKKEYKFDYAFRLDHKQHSNRKGNLFNRKEKKAKNRIRWEQYTRRDGNTPPFSLIFVLRNQEMPWQQMCLGKLFLLLYIPSKLKIIFGDIVELFLCMYWDCILRVRGSRRYNWRFLGKVLPVSSYAPFHLTASHEKKKNSRVWALYRESSRASYRHLTQHLRTTLIPAG